ncbi:MAG TPA: D-alanyl-D-alanine carboxypeptidase/D-alanyl-D-alanine-endopeptidase [Pyrinomonadaceae bacterium]|nr:D-alanyl-D-alanine carboxypeptidase/D-alanyl-D-alanine-endopeptidase [Pyrinomonadaceae bacterium]
MRIAQILRKPELQAAMVGIKVASLDTGRVLFEQNAKKLLRPASNMKLYTVSAALDRLSPDFRFTTSVFADAKPDAAGVIHGNLTIYGRGDPSIAARFNKGNYFKGIDDLATRISGAGVKRVEGDLVGDETYFVGPQYGSGWDWEDLQWWYGAEVSALTVNDNALDLCIKPGAQVGVPASVTTGPPDPLLTIVNHVKTGPKGSKRELTVHRGLNDNTLEVSGTIPLGDRGYTGGIGISHPALLFVYLLRTALGQLGVTVSGQSRTKGAVNQALLTAGATLTTATGAAAPKTSGSVEIASMQSPPLSIVAANTLKPSQNLYTEIILRTLGKMAVSSGLSSARTSEFAGIEVVKAFLKEAGLNPDSLVLSDGSGLSRNDMVTAEASVRLLTYMSNHKYATALRDALPIAGVDGTLRNRLKGTVAENNVRAKTGTLASATSLSGYVTTAAGEKLVFSIMVNNYPSDVEPREVCIDPIAVLLASFAGRP